MACIKGGTLVSGWPITGLPPYGHTVNGYGGFVTGAGYPRKAGAGPPSCSAPFQSSTYAFLSRLKKLLGCGVIGAVLGAVVCSGACAAGSAVASVSAGASDSVADVAFRAGSSAGVCWASALCALAKMPTLPTMTIDTLMLLPTLTVIAPPSS